MEIFIFRFSLKELRTIHPDHLGFILASGHCCNEIVCVTPYILFEHGVEDANEVEKAFISIRQLTIIRLLASKIVEYHELTNSYFAKIRRTFPAKCQTLQSRYRPIGREIARARWARKIRNSMSFHFDQESALKSAENFSAEAELNFMAGRMKGATALNFSEEILSRPVFDELGEGDLNLGVERAISFLVKAHSSITDFHAQMMDEVFTQYGLFKKPDKIEMREKYYGDSKVVRIPLLISE